MEVTLKTEVEAGASGFSVTGGGDEGIFIKKVLKESPASKIFSLREGDQLLSATIFFDNIKYEDALKILQYSEPYRVQFSLKRKIAGKEELEHVHSTAQYKNERKSQEKELSESIPEETLHVSGKAISEEDRETLIVSQRAGRSKRPKKDRLSWPKFQSIKNKKILGHRRSHSTSDAYEPAIQDISPTSTDTESQSQQEVHIKEKKGSQKKLKFPSIGFKMHRSKPEPQDKQKKEIKTTLLSEREKIHKEGISLENPEILTVEYTASPAYEIKTGEVHETLTKDLNDMKNGIPSHAKKCPEVEITIKKEKEKESTSKFTVPEVSAVTTQISTPCLETPDVKESPTKQTPQASSKSRKKKQKGTADKRVGESGINIDIMGHTAQGSIQLKGLEIATAKTELHMTYDTLETGEKQAEEDTHILTIQKTKSGISMPKTKESEAEKNKPGSDGPHSVPEKTVDKSSEDGRNLEVKPHMSDTESEVSTWKIQTPSLKMAKIPKVDMKIPREESTLESVDTVKKEKREEDSTSASDKSLKMDIGMNTMEKDIEGKESKFRLPKFKLPTFTWNHVEEQEEKTAITKQRIEKKPGLISKKTGEIPQNTQGDIKIPKVDISLPSVDVTLPKASVDLQAPEAALTLEGEAKAPEKEAAKTKDGKFKMPKFGMPSFGWSSSREAKSTVAADVDVSLKEPQATVPSGTAEVDVTLPGAEIQAPSFDVVIDSSSLKEDIVGKDKSSLFRMPKVSLSKSSKPQTHSKSVVEISVSEDLCYSVTEETPAVISGSVGSKLTDTKGDSGSKYTKFRIPSLGFSKVDIGSSKIELDSPLPKGDITLTKYQINLAEYESKISPLADKNLSVTDAEISKEYVSLEQRSLKPGIKTPADEISAVGTEFTVKIPKFRKPKFGISRSKGKPLESDIVSKVESEISKGRITPGMTDIDTEQPAQISDAELIVTMHRPSPEVTLNAPTLDVSLPSMELTMPKLEIHGPDLDGKAEQEVVSGEKDTEEKENTFKTSKFKLPSFSWSPKKEGVAPSEVEGHMEEPTLSTLSGDTESELTFPTPENQYLHAEFDTSTEKDGEKGRSRRSQFIVPKISFPKIKGQKVQVSLPILETDVSGPKQEKEGVSVQKSEKISRGEGAGMGIKMPKVTVPTLEFSKPEITAPKIEMDISMPTGEVILPTCEEDDLVSKSAAANASLSTSDTKMITEGSLEVKSPDTRAGRKSSEIAVSDVEIKIEGKGSEKEASQTKSEVKVPQIKATVEIADIAVEAPNLKVECGTGTETHSPEVQMTKADNKVLEADIHLPSVDISFPKTDSDIQDPDAALKIKGEIKEDGDGEEKEGHFKMPKFKLPSFSWSPKKEASVKPDSGVNLEDQKIAVKSSKIDTEVRGTATEDKGTGPALDLEISAGKVEQKSTVKKPQFVMPKISLSKIKVPKSQMHSPKAEADATVPKTEGEGDDSIQIPDIERSHYERREGAQISIKLADVKIPTLESSKIETGAPKSEMGVSSAKADAALPLSEGSFQQVVLKSSSTDEDTIQKTGIKFPKGEASIELRGSEIATESSAVVDGRKMKFEGPEGKIKIPKFQKSKFGISLTKGKGPETEISSPKIEAELPQLKVTKEIADIAVRVPASELTSDMSDPGVGVCKIKTPQSLTAGIEASKIDISPETSLKEKKGDADIERSMEKAHAGIPSAEVQTETSIPENAFSLPHTVAKITIGKEGIPKLGDSVKSSDVSLSKMEGDISLSTKRTDSSMNIPKNETYADIVKHGAEVQKLRTSEFTVSSAELSKSYLSASEIEKENSLTNRFPTCALTLQEYKVEPQDIEVPKAESCTKLETSGVGCRLSSAEITLDATQKKIDVSLPKEELDIKNQEAANKKQKIKGEMKIIGKGSEGSELKMPTCELPTTKGSEDGVYVTAKLEDVKVEVPGVKMDVKIARVDPEMKFQMKSVEKDMSAGVEVQVEDRPETSKIKTYKFKIPRLGLLHSEVKGFEDDINLPKSEADSVSKTEIGTAEMQFQKSEGSIGLKSPALAHVEAPARITVETVDKSQGGPEVNIKIPKLKIPRFTFKALPTEADISVSKVVTDPKGSSTDIEIVQLQASSAIPGQTPDALEGDIQKAKSKILTLTEPDIKTAEMTTTIESSLSNIGQDIHWSYVEGQEVSEKVEPEHVAIERCEIYTTEILKESEILSSEVKTATLGFSLLKVKMPESHSNLEVLVQQPSSTEDVSVSKPTYADESFRAAAQRTGSAELKLPEKPQSESEGCSGEVSLPKLKTFAAEAKPSSKLEGSLLNKSPEGITAGPFSKDEDVAEALEDEEKDITNEKEKTDSKRSPGRFKFWLPNIGFSSSGDETSTDSKTEVKKSVPEDVKPADTSDTDSAKQTEKTGWFRFPKLGFTSPSKKPKSVDKEEMGHKEGIISDEESPSDKPDVFFDAQESLSPKETTEGEKVEIDGASSSVPVSGTIVTSSARTELILLEEEKDSQSNIPGDTTK
ncbi:PREDICTED: protein AHNAK2-like [Leptosomus discolor]|uniref:protein AHNAK2-like n=1 Tax=Leptosomus discolor TaxID=188344 RepID=UPI000522CF99|nr:PREDICTED: protein AHNAK2-like [Leptosomus discolor]